MIILLHYYHYYYYYSFRIIFYLFLFFNKQTVKYKVRVVLELCQIKASFWKLSYMVIAEKQRINLTLKRRENNETVAGSKCSIIEKNKQTNMFYL